MNIIVSCAICQWSAPVTSEEKACSRYLIHFIDDHWDVVKRIRVTTGDPAGRLELNRQLAAELGRGTT